MDIRDSLSALKGKCISIDVDGGVITVEMNHNQTGCGIYEIVEVGDSSFTVAKHGYVPDCTSEDSYQRSLNDPSKCRRKCLGENIYSIQHVAAVIVC